MTAAMLPVESELAMLALIRARRDELGLTHETLDAIAGLPTGWSSKVLAEPPCRRMGSQSLALVLGALGYGIALFHDEAGFERIRSRLRPRSKSGRKPKRLRIGKPWLFTRKNAHEMALLAVAKRDAIRRRGERNRANARKRWAKRGICAPAHADHAL